MCVYKTEHPFLIGNYAAYFGLHEIFPFYYIPLPNFPAVIVFQTRVLADGFGSYFISKWAAY